MADININSSTIRTQAETLSTLNVQFQSQVNQLKELEGALNSSWDGEANDAFHAAFSSDVAQMDNFYKVINDYVAVLTNSASRYEVAEQKNAATATNRSY